MQSAPSRNLLRRWLVEVLDTRIKTSKNLKRSRTFGVCVILVAVLLLLSCLEYELPVGSVTNLTDTDLYITYWDKTSPRIRLTLACNENDKSCSIQAYRSYSASSYLNPRREKLLTLPAKYRGYHLTSNRRDLQGYETVTGVNGAPDEAVRQ